MDKPDVTITLPHEDFVLLTQAARHYLDSVRYLGDIVPLNDQVRVMMMDEQLRAVLNHAEARISDG